MRWTLLLPIRGVCHSRESGNPQGVSAPSILLYIGVSGDEEECMNIRIEKRITDGGIHVLTCERVDSRFRGNDTHRGNFFATDSAKEFSIGTNGGASNTPSAKNATDPSGTFDPIGEYRSRVRT